MKPVNFIDPSATLGTNVRVWHFARILQDVVIDDDVSIGSGAEIGRGSVIGARTRISANVFLPPNSHVGSNVFIGPGVIFTDDRYPRANNPGYKAEPPYIHSGASIGAGAVILPNVIVHSFATIGAGAVVTKSVPAHTTFYGPAATKRATPPEMAVSL